MGGLPTRRWEYNIKMYHKQNGCALDSPDSEQAQITALVENKVIKLRVAKNAGNMTKDCSRVLPAGYQTNHTVSFHQQTANFTTSLFPLQTSM